MQPRLLEDGQVCVDMGPPILQAAKVPTTLSATQVASPHRKVLSVSPYQMSFYYLLVTKSSAKRV